LSRMFPVPKEMTEEEIEDAVRRFARTAALAERAGFTGVEIHAAHGYLLSQFLATQQQAGRSLGRITGKSCAIAEENHRGSPC
jgi:NADH:flavin oxidoreductase / NADH oxidase family